VSIAVATGVGATRGAVARAAGLRRTRPKRHPADAPLSGPSSPTALNDSARSFQTAYYQRIRSNLWQISWVEETGTTVTMALDIEQRRITTFMSFSKGHWEHAEEAHGDKRDPEALAR
jgi:hypothetical protein